MAFVVCCASVRALHGTTRRMLTLVNRLRAIRKECPFPRQIYTRIANPIFMHGRTHDSGHCWIFARRIYIFISIVAQWVGLRKLRKYIKILTKDVVWLHLIFRQQLCLRRMSVPSFSKQNRVLENVTTIHWSRS